jgi:D-glycero-D-manno-heptose 1,7-bisphosphate phosphatase
VRSAVFLDRDGVLNELVPDPLTDACESPLDVEDVRLVPGAAVAAAQLARLGYVLVCVSNQPAAAKGTVSVAQLRAVHARVLELLALEGVALDHSRLCLHHEHGVVPRLSKPCSCRKPAPGMLLDAAASLGLDVSSSWMVGDTDADISAGIAAGTRTVLIRNPASVHKRLQAVSPTLTADDLADAVRKLRSNGLDTLVKN